MLLSKLNIIVFLGTDGSGKSTLIHHLRIALENEVDTTIYFEHLRPNLFPSLASLLQGERGHEEIITNPHAQMTSGCLGSFMRWSYYLLDYTLGYFLKIYSKRFVNSSIWVFDRYYYDYFIDPKRLRVKLPKWLLKIGELLIPKPDLVFCLGADPEIIYDRKPELPLQEIYRQMEVLKVFCENNEKAIWIDTGHSIEQSFDKMLPIILLDLQKNDLDFI